MYVRMCGYLQVAPMDMFSEVNTGTNLPAQIELYATPGNEYHFLFIAKGNNTSPHVISDSHMTIIDCRIF